jgi:hypothetical protein
VLDVRLAELVVRVVVVVVPGTVTCERPAPATPATEPRRIEERAMPPTDTDTPVG